jgi:TRAP-type C4-dicarboxylate transport system permease large subunit
MKMSIKGTRTEKNILTAFAGESQARNRYTYFAAQARKDGFVQMAEMVNWSRLSNGVKSTALMRRALTPRLLLEILMESARTTAMLFTILIAAMIFTNFINFTSMPGDLKEFVLQFSPHPIMVVVVMMGIYLMLGMVMEELAIVLLTIPVFFPIITGLGFDPVWFGILIVTVVEIGLISPPVGLNLFVINSLLKDVKLSTIYRGVWPFVAADVVRLAILIAIPAIALWLPSFMK